MLAELALASVVSMCPIVIAIVIAWMDEISIVNFYAEKSISDSFETVVPNFSEEKISKSFMDTQTSKSQFLLSDVKPLEMISDIVTLKNVVGQ